LAKRVFVSSIVPSAGLDPLLAPDIEILQGGLQGPTSYEELAQRATDCHGLLCVLSDRVDAALLDAGADSLKVVANIAVGHDNIDLARAAANGVTVCNTPGVLDGATADLTLFLILAACRLTTDAETDLRAGAWEGWSVTGFLGHDLSGRTLGLVGYGRIAKAVASRSQSFGLNVLHWTRRPTGVKGWVADLDELLSQSDIVSIHVPLNAETHHLIDEGRLKLLRPDSVLVNTARGPVVDEIALADALAAGRLFAAGLDVYENEPGVSAALLAAPRTVLMPHIGSATHETRTAMVRLAAQGVRDVLDDRRPSNQVTVHDAKEPLRSRR
jgi:glyoxylate reductase